MKRKELQFRIRVVKLVDVYVYMSEEDCEKMYPCITFEFDDRNTECDSGMYYPLANVENKEDATDTVKSLFKLLKSRKKKPFKKRPLAMDTEIRQELIGTKLLVLEYRFPADNSDWMEWELAGYGQYFEDKFIDAFGDGQIISEAELEEIVLERECN